MDSMEARPVGLVHDYLLVTRGAERTFAAMADCWPDAPIYTLLYSRQGTDQRFAERVVHTSYLQRLGIRQNRFRCLLPLFPRAAEKLPVHEHDLVISSTSAFAHGVRPAPDAVHIAYCHTPFRYAWHERGRALEETPRPLRPLVRRMLGRIRQWDLTASRAVTHYIANSDLTQRQIKEYWGREASVIHPPVEVHRFRPGTPEDYFLVVAELVRHKQVDLALDAARRAGQRIKVVGAGPEFDRLKAVYGSSAEFLGRISDSELADVYARARALVVPNVEEFGIAAVEAQAAGRPVIAANAGGVRETVIDGLTGILVEPDVEQFAEALRYTDFDRFEPKRISGHVQRFSTEAFQRGLMSEIARLTDGTGPGSA